VSLFCSRQSTLTNSVSQNEHDRVTINDLNAQLRDAKRMIEELKAALLAQSGAKVEIREIHTSQTIDNSSEVASLRAEVTPPPLQWDVTRG